MDRKYLRREIQRGLIVLTVLATGCSLEESMVDGFFQGITDTIAAVISRALVGP